jgi:acyl transferase domain-containing protein
MSSKQKEPIAIVGIGCRFPGDVNTAEGFWQSLLAGTDAVSEIPASRFDYRQFFHPDPARPGKMYTPLGTFVQQYDQFDAAFFGISGSEAEMMDPQQRLLLMTSWEALEDGGIVPESLAGSQTGVFIGICTGDYGTMRHQDIATINAYTNGGRSYSIVSNRISYAFDFRGPSFSVDTACSSSLVGVHLACESLRAGECSLAIAGGVQLTLDPGWNVGFCKAHMLSPSGRCHAFDSSGDGYVRGEGVGVIVLKPLAQALADGNPVYAVIAGTGINQDGKTPSLHQPSRAAQEALLRQVYDQAGIDPSLVYYVEAHGTGTPVGDPIEAEALGNVLGYGRSMGEWLRIGSVKTNIGHLEAASGIAGLIKAALILKHRQIPANLHFQTPHPKIPFDQLHLKVLQTPEAIPATVSPLIAGVNSFGYGGTNAHVVLQELPGHYAVQMHPDERSYLFPFSARSASALRDLGQAYLERLLTDSVPSLHDLCYSASRTRSHHAHRAALVVQSVDDLREKLGAFLGTPERGPIAQTDDVAFVYSGNGPQWWAMGRQLLQEEPVFREVVERCDQALRPYSGWSLMEELLSDETHSRMHLTSVAQPALFAVQIALTTLWQTWGITPQAVIGHSVGEIAAAYVAGILSFDDAIRVVFERSRCQELTAGTGKMAALGISAEDALPLLIPYEGRVSLASVNSPGSVTLSGDESALEEIMQGLKQRGVFCRLLALNYAFHSPAMDPIREDLLHSLAEIQPEPSRVPFVSTVTGRQLTGPECDANYWWDNIRQPVQFAVGIGALQDLGTTIFLEVGPHPVLSSYISECMADRRETGTILPSLRRMKDERVSLLSSLSVLYTHGSRLCWDKLVTGGNIVPLPFYPWQLQRYWIEAKSSGVSVSSEYVHPLLGYRLRAADATWENTPDTQLVPYLADHVVQNTIIFPAAGYIEMLLAAAKSIFGDESPVAIEQMDIHKPLALAQAQIVQTTVTTESHAFHISSRKDDRESEWTHHVSGTIRKLSAVVRTVSLPEVRGRLRYVLTGPELYQNIVRRGLQLGPSFQTVESVAFGEGEAVGVIRWPETLEADYFIHPLLLDSGFQIACSVLVDEVQSDQMYLPVGLEELRYYRRPNPLERLYSYVQICKRGRGYGKANYALVDEGGKLIMEVVGLRIQVAHSGSLTQDETLQYETHWVPDALSVQGSAEEQVDEPGIWLIFADDSGVAMQVKKQLVEHATNIIFVEKGAYFQRISDRLFILRADSREDIEQLFDTLRKEGRSIAHIVYMWGLDSSPFFTPTPAALVRAVDTGCTGILSCVQAVVRAGDHPHIWIVTGGVHAQEGAEISQAPLYGLGRVIGNEHPELRCTLINLSKPYAGEYDREEIHALSRELLHSTESEVLLQGSTRYVNRIMPRLPQLLTHEVLKQPEMSFRLDMQTPGVLDHLVLRAVPRMHPNPGEVEIAVAATGMNFKDVLVAMGVIAGEALSIGYAGGFALGLECAGTIVTVGEGVTDLQVGDHVIAVGRNCFSSHVTTDAHFVVRKPGSISFEESATIPITFLTAHYALHVCGHIRKGERVLIHGAAGGVGLAAIQIVQQAGGEVFATAGSPEKRAYLRTLGVQHVLDSRSLAFADEIMQITNGEGVDIVLNSLAGEAQELSLRVLRSFGRFLEIGKRDILEKKKLGLLPFERCLTFCAIDIDQLMRRDKPLIQQMMSELRQSFEEGIYHPLPYQPFLLSQVVDAFQYLQQSRQIGKVVVTMSQQSALVEREGPQALTLHEDGSYLITGGLSGFGLATAAYLARQGARALVLVNRSGRVSREAQTVISEMRAIGAQVLVVGADVAQEQEVEKLLARIREQFPPLRGIIHSAMVLEDCSILNLSRESLWRVLAPKMLGAWNLHVQTRALPLDFFVLYSSISALVGNPGQGNYAAANLFLDALGSYRRAQGLPALTIQWGALAEVGHVGEHEEVRHHLSRLGVHTLSPEQAFSALGQLLQESCSPIMVGRVDWKQVGTTLLAAHAQARLTQLRERTVQEQPEELHDDALDQEQRVYEYLRQTLMKMLNMPDIDLQSTDRLQLDSLMVMELRNSMKQATGLDLPTLPLATALSLSELCAVVSEQWAKTTVF